MPSTTTRHPEASDTSLKSGNVTPFAAESYRPPTDPLYILNLVLLNNAFARLSPRQYKQLQELRKEFPTIVLERMPRPPNCFILFRTEYVAEKKEANEEKGSEDNGASSRDKTSRGDRYSNGDQGPNGGEASGGGKDPDGDEVSGDRMNSNSDPKSGSNNQTAYSKEAGVIWRRDYPEGSPQREVFESWSRRSRVLWKTMYPNGLPALLRIEKKRPAKSPSKSNVTSSSPSSPSPSVPHKSFQPLPSPPISDSGDFERNIIRDHGDDGALESEDALEDSDKDEDYVPKKSSHKRRSSRRKHSVQKQPRLELLTPVSMTRELSPRVPSRSPSPTPVFFNSGSISLLPLVIPSVTLSELNGEGPSTFVAPSTHSALSSCGASRSRGPREFFEQIAVGYSIEEQDNISIVDWNQTDLMSDLDPVGLFPIMNLPYHSDSLMTSPTNDFSHQLIVDEAMTNDW